ncbi:hypothetical protein BU16DRAFT_535252 [Lophium mytilinum]|uniref:Uncharacterized protein n=1 Tax=Lophium mytilinum TaxID=390894 RepID=A0A6A6R8G4_9PEZI|nr:hypothetical protein BU16DRAFT_535252 [Lophium mytilinum]
MDSPPLSPVRPFGFLNHELREEPNFALSDGKGKGEESRQNNRYQEKLARPVETREGSVPISQRQFELLRTFVTVPTSDQNGPGLTVVSNTEQQLQNLDSPPSLLDAGSRLSPPISTSGELLRVGGPYHARPSTRREEPPGSFSGKSISTSILKPLLTKEALGRHDAAMEAEHRHAYIFKPELEFNTEPWKNIRPRNTRPVGEEIRHRYEGQLHKLRMENDELRREKKALIVAWKMRSNANDRGNLGDASCPGAQEERDKLVSKKSESDRQDEETIRQECLEKRNPSASTLHEYTTRSPLVDDRLENLMPCGPAFHDHTTGISGYANRS